MNKEAIYDAEINPLMAQIIATCQKAGIAMLCSFHIPTEDDPSLACTSCTPDGYGDTPDHLVAARRAIMQPPSFAIFTVTSKP